MEAPAVQRPGSALSAAPYVHGARTGPRRSTSTGRAQRSLVDGAWVRELLLGLSQPRRELCRSQRPLPLGRPLLHGGSTAKAAKDSQAALVSEARWPAKRLEEAEAQLREIAVSIPFLTGFVLRLRMTTRTLPGASPASIRQLLVDIRRQQRHLSSM